MLQRPQKLPLMNTTGKVLNHNGLIITPDEYCGRIIDWRMLTATTDIYNVQIVQRVDLHAN